MGKRPQEGEKWELEVTGSLGKAMIEPRSLHCIDCDGFPLDNGSVFVAVFRLKEGKAELGGICELCWLKRLQRRGQIVNMTSDNSFQIDLPQLGIHKVHHQPIDFRRHLPPRTRKVR